MFSTTKKPLHQTPRFGKVDAPAVSEETLAQFHSLYSRATEGADAVTTLVLGATPELRDLVLSFPGHELITVDRDQTALTKKTGQMFHRQSNRERIVVEDWLDLDFSVAQFDVILGDGVLTSLHRADQATLLKKLHHILKPTGYLLLRESAVLHARPRYAPSVHIHEYRTGQYNIFDLFFGLRLHNSQFKAINTETRKTYLKDFQIKLEEYKNNGLLAPEEFNQLGYIAEELEHTMLRKEDLEQLLLSQFYAKEVIHDIGSGHLSPWYFFLVQRNDLIELPNHVPAGTAKYRAAVERQSASAITAE